MKKWFVKGAIFSLAILLAELLYAICLHYLNNYKRGYNAYQSTAISMAAAVVFFYPVLGFLNKHLKTVSEAYMKWARKASKGNFAGLLAGFSLALFLLFASFAWLWYNKNVFADIKNWFVNLF